MLWCLHAGDKVRRPRSSVPAAPQFDGTFATGGNAASNHMSTDATSQPAAAAGTVIAANEAKSADPTHADAAPLASPRRAGKQTADSVAAARQSPRASPRAVSRSAAAAAAAGKKAATTTTKCQQSIVQRAAAIPSRIPAPARSPAKKPIKAGTTVSIATAVVAPAGKERPVSASPRQASNEDKKPPAPPAASHTEKKPTPQAEPTAAAALPTKNTFAAWLSATGATLQSPGVTKPLQRRSPRKAAPAASGVDATPAVTAVDAEQEPPKVPTDPVLTEPHGPRARTGLKSVTKPRESGVNSSSIDTAGLSKSLFASEDGNTAAAAAVAGTEEVTGMAAQLEAAAAKSPRRSPRKSSGLAGATPAGGKAATAARSPAQDKEFSFGNTLAAVAGASPVSVGGLLGRASAIPASARRQSSKRSPAKAAQANAASSAGGAAPAESFSFGFAAAEPSSCPPLRRLEDASAMNDTPAAASSGPAGSISFGTVPPKSPATAATSAKSLSFAAGVPAAAADVAVAAGTPAVSSAIAMTSPGGVSVCYGQFAPLMGAPSTLTMSGWAAGSSVTGALQTTPQVTYHAAGRVTLGML